MQGRVTLLGAGPGDPELLTLIGRRRLAEADVVLYDRLVDPSLLAFTNDQVELVDVGKLPKHHKVKQTQINQMLVDYARDGKKVVRLKAGDPYVFGRGGEEAQTLADQGVPFEVIPGITSAIAGLAAVGIPITHRDFASSFHIITGHHKKDGQKMDWPNIAHQEGTLVFLMGMAELPNICAQLIQNGKDAHTPVAIIQWATQWRQKMVTGDLMNIVELVKEHHLGAPALIVVGHVVTLSKTLNVHRPLAGFHLLVPASKHGRLFNRLADLGATADFYPRAIKESVAADLTQLAEFSTFLIDDPTAFDLLVQQLVTTGRDLRWFAGKTIIAANRVVARHLSSRGIICQGTLPEAKLPADFLELGGMVPETKGKFLSLYHESHKNEELPFNLTEFDAVVFPSTASLRDFLTALSDDQRADLVHLRAFVMGDRVYQAARDAGFARVIKCQPKIEKTVATVKEDLLND